MIKWIYCLINRHNWQYFSENYQTNKSVFKCNNCNKTKEE